MYQLVRMWKIFLGAAIIAGLIPLYLTDKAFASAPTANIVVAADKTLIVGETSLVTITFSEAVNGFGNEDLSADNGTLSAVSSSDGGITWTATLTPAAGIADPSNIITLNNAGVANAAGNAGTGSTPSNNYAIDTIRPTASIVVDNTTLIAGETSLVTINFSEGVTGFSIGDLTTSNGTLSNLTTFDNISWTLTLTPAAGITETSNIITLNNTGVIDAVGNAGTGSTPSNNYAIDTIRPTASIVVADLALIAGETSLVTITFSEAVTGFGNDDLITDNGTLSSVSSADGGISWTATLTPTAGTVDISNIITLNNAGVTDVAGNTGIGSTPSNNYSIDTVRPTASIMVADPALIVGETSLVTITFSEAVSGFGNENLTTDNGTLSAVSSFDGGISWTAILEPAADITDASNIITLDNAGVANAAGNAGTGSTDSNNYAIDTMRPTSSITVADDALTIGETSLVTITFSEAVVGFSNACLTVGNGTLSAVSTSDGGIKWTATLTPSGNVTVATNIITLQNSCVRDVAGNAGQGSTTSNHYSISTMPASQSNGTVSPDSTVIATDGNLTLPIGKTGVVSLGNEVMISIPAGASLQELKISIAKVLNTENLLTNKEVLASPVFEILKNFSENFGKPVTLTFAFDSISLKSNQTVAVFYYDEGMKEWVKVEGGILNGNRITAEVNHFTKFAVLAVDLATGRPVTEQPTDMITEVSFSDISGHWAEANIKQAVISGIVKGFSDGTFKPGKTVTRAEFAVMLMNALKPQEAGTDLTFKDTAKIGVWAQKAVAQAVQADIFKGYMDGTFRPNAEITRAEMATMIARALKLSIEENAGTGFADDAIIPLWVKGAAAAMKKLGIMEGTGANEFIPEAKVNRAEAVTMLLRMLEQK